MTPDVPINAADLQLIIGDLTAIVTQCSTALTDMTQEAPPPASHKGGHWRTMNDCSIDAEQSRAVPDARFPSKPGHPPLPRHASVSELLITRIPFNCLNDISEPMSPEFLEIRCQR